MTQRHAIYLSPAPSIVAHRKRKPFAAYFFTGNILHCTVFTKHTPNSFYTRNFVHTPSFFNYCSGLLHRKQFYTSNTPTPKAEVFLTKQLCHQKPMIHPYYRTNPDPRMNCHRLYAKIQHFVIWQCFENAFRARCPSRAEVRHCACHP